MNIRKMILNTALFIIIMIFSVGCSTLTGFFFPDAPEKDLKVEWRKDLKMEINGKVYWGMALVDRTDSYSIKVFPPDKRIDRLQWRTCHAEGFADKAVKHGFWPWSEKDEYFKFSIKLSDIEKDRACPIVIEALVAKHKSFSFGLIVIPYSGEEFQLSGALLCNGEVKSRVGTSECQAPYKSIQRISFPEKVFQDTREDSSCPPLKEVSDGSFEYFMPKDLCVYPFKVPRKHENGKFLMHTLITYGYEKIPPPEEGK